MGDKGYQVQKTLLIPLKSNQIRNAFDKRFNKLFNKLRVKGKVHSNLDLVASHLVVSLDLVVIYWDTEFLLIKNCQFSGFGLILRPRFSGQFFREIIDFGTKNVGFESDLTEIHNSWFRRPPLLASPTLILEI